MITSGTCESCGMDDEHLAPVHRKYLATDEVAERVLDEVERWCVACCTSYPHEPAG